MIVKVNTVAKFLGILFLLANIGLAQSQGSQPSIAPEREIIVMFKSDAVTPPENRTKGRPEPPASPAGPTARADR